MMEHKGTVLIETERLTLRRFLLSDSEAAFCNWTNDEEVTEFLTWPPHKDANATREVIAQWLEQYAADNYYQWAIVLKEINEPIGSIAVVRQEEDLGIVEVGYCIGKKWWNKGMVSEAFAAVVSYLFKEVKVNRIAMRHDTQNPNSGKVMLKCGLQYEGTLRASAKNNRGIADMAMYGILAKDFFRK